MDLSYYIDLPDEADSAPGNPYPGSMAAFADPERAYPRSVTSSSPGRDVVCHATLGTTVSVTRVTPGLCGSDKGCDGRWHCVTGRLAERPQNQPALTA